MLQMTNIKLILNKYFLWIYIFFLYWMRNRRKYSDINYDKRMTFLGTKHPFSWLAIKQRSKRAVVISFLDTCVYVYIEIYTYIYTRWPDWPIICSSGQPTRRRLPLPDNIAFCPSVLSYARVSENGVNGIREKDGGLSALMHLCISPKPVASILEARAQVLRYVSLNLQFKSRSDRAS